MTSFGGEQARPESCLDVLADRTSKPAAAAAACAFSVQDSAKDIKTADSEEMTSIVTTGLGIGSTAATCTHAAQQVVAQNQQTGELVSLADELDQLPERAEQLDRIKGNLENAQRFATAADELLQFIVHR